MPEATFESGGSTWRARVLGRAGRVHPRSPPLLLLGFWGPDAEDGPHAREALVVARALSDLTPARLAALLGRASPRPPADREKRFFEGASQGRRGGRVRRDG